MRTRFFRNGPYAQQLWLNRTYELILLGFTDDTDQPTFGIRFHAAFTAGIEDTNLFVDSDSDFEWILKLTKKLGACTPKLLSPAEIEVTEVWQARTVPWPLYKTLCRSGGAEDAV